MQTRDGTKTGADSSRGKLKCDRCPEPPSDDPEMDRREAAFATMGTLWSLGVIPSAVMPTAFSSPDVANAVYGSDAKIEMPNIVEGMSNRVNKQCLVESLGNRECLVYMDSENQLYKGADNQVLLERVEKASVQLASIPELVDAKCWSKVRGVLTGPLGTLLATMNQLSKLSSNPSESDELARKVKLDIFAIADAAEKKQGAQATESHRLATEHLVAFLKSL